MFSSPIVLTTTICFCLTYIGLAFGRIPGLKIDRAGIAVCGMAAMLACGVMTLGQAFQAIDYQTITLLFGMMVLVAYLQIGGLFDIIADWVVSLRPGPWSLLALTMGMSGVLSALLVNDVVCVTLTPLVLDICRRCRRQPIPYLIGLATASNVGSVATLTGNPQNMIIGSLSGISYLHFAVRLTPIAIAALSVNFLVVAWVYRSSITTTTELAEDQSTRPAAEIDKLLLYKGCAVTLGLIVLFFAGQPVAVVALGAGAIMLAGRVRPEEIYRRVDWPLLAMFVGLFVVVHGFEEKVIRLWPIHEWRLVAEQPIVTISALAAILSNLVSNVPAVLLFKPIIDTIPNPENSWIVLAMSSTFAGNLTLLGSVANLIVVENAHRAGIEISFREYLKVGIPVTLITIVIGTGWVLMTA